VAQNSLLTCTFTVFTPAYNRQDTIPRVYESLRAQTYRDFEWLVVDAGTDQTAELLAQWQEETPWFPIRYVRQENRGKHGAINFGITQARGRFFLILDDDDECVPEALERFKSVWESIPEAERSGFGGICSLCTDEQGGIDGTRFPQDVIDSTFPEIRHRYRVRGEKFHLFLTSVLKEFPFPEDPTVRIIPEGIVWDRISKKYRVRFVNEPLRRYRRDQRQLTRGLPHEHAAGNCITIRELLDETIGWFRFDPIYFVKNAAHYSRFSLHLGRGLIGPLKSLVNPWARTLFCLMAPVGVAAYLRDRIAAPDGA